MAPVVRSTGRPVLKANAVALTTAPQGETMKLRAVVEVQNLWNSIGQPANVELFVLQPALLRESCHGKRQAHRCRGRRMKAEDEAEHDPGCDVKGDRYPRTPHGAAMHLIDHHDVDQRVVHLHEFKGPSRSRWSAQWGAVGYPVGSERLEPSIAQSRLDRPTAGGRDVRGPASPRAPLRNPLD